MIQSIQNSLENRLKSFYDSVIYVLDINHNLCETAYQKSR